MNELAALKGIGPKIIEKLNTLGIYNTNDLLEYYPRTYVDKTGISHISDIREGEYFSLKGILYNITSKQLPYGRRLHIVTAEFKDQTGQISVTWFNQPYLKNVLKEKKMIYLYGKVEKKGFFYNIYNPDFSYNEKDFFIIQPIYSKNAKINQYEIRKAVKSAMDYSHVLVKDYFPEYLKERYSLCDKEFAVRNIHFPTSSADFFAARRRLVFEEFFLMQLALVSLKSNIGKDKSPINISKFDMAREFVRSLPFTPTDAQLQSIKDIASDLKSGYSMHRLLQGDVGSGKTVVALYAVMCAYRNGYQSAFMAPTEILALQHYRTAVELLSKFGLNIVLLTGQLRKKEREDILNSIEKVLLGPQRKSHLLSPEEKKIAAYHEAGHAIVANFLPNCDPVQKVTIISRGMAAGYTLNLPEKETYLHSKEYYIDEMAMLLGGYIVEKEIFKSLTSGPSNDLEKVTSIAKDLIYNYGMSNELPPRIFGEKDELFFLGNNTVKQDFSEKTAQIIDNEISNLINLAYNRAKDAILNHKDKLELVAETLIKQETIEKEEFKKLVQTN